MSLRPNERMDARKRFGYKPTFDKDDARKKREDNIVEIRKNKREEGLLKKRRDGTGHIEFPLNNNIMSSLVAAVMSQDTRAQIDATFKFRQMLCKDDNPPIDEIIKTGVVAHFVNFLQREDSYQLQLEAAWALTNIASGTSEHTRVVIEHGAVPIFIHLISSPHEELREQVLWALANIAGDSVECRDFLLINGATMTVLAQLNEDAELPILRTGAWTLSNLCRRKPPPPFEQVQPALPTLARLLQTNDKETVVDAAWALSYISDMHAEGIQAVIEAGVGHKLMELSMHPSESVILPILRIIGNFAAGSDTQTQHVIDIGILPRLGQLITHNHKKSIIKEACWTISNLTAATMDQIQAVIDARIIPALISLLNNADFWLRRESCFGVTNAIICGNNEQIEYIVNEGCINPLCDLLSCRDISIVANCLESLEEILRVGDHTGNISTYIKLIENAGGVDMIETLEEHECEDIYAKAVRILEKYFANDEMEEGQFVEDVDTSNLSIPSNQPTSSNFD